ncbi:hypothetical protein CK203_065207 [Vitis vinifera]|uniref:Uncharacterized protein n=1 Tax=Vitis vinifera TaxID=29760 RepID=A0A438G5C2_VITVI|nr:hypothetical protein CK203_065207 [Vitis vinifera]
MKDKWFLDSGCSRHMTGDESKFAFLTKRKGGYVTFGDNSKGKIIGQGNIDRRQQEEVVEDPKKEKSPLALPPPQQVQGESSQDLPKNWKFVINHPQDQIIEFSKCMHSEFEMSMMGELNFFLGLQIKQLKEGTFIHQAKYIRDLLKRFNMEEAKTMKTPMSSSITLTWMRKVEDLIFGRICARVLVWNPGFHLLRASSLCTARLRAASSFLLSFSLWAPSSPFVSLDAPRRETGTSKAQGKRPVEPSQPKQMEARRKARFDTALFSSNEDYQR